MKIVKFGGKSLANGKGLESTLSIISNKFENGEKIAVVVSARGKTTDHLESILEKSKADLPYADELSDLKNYQTEMDHSIDLNSEFQLLDEILRGVNLLGDFSDKVKDQVLSTGEIMSAKTIANLLNNKGIKANFVDACPYY